MTDKQIEGVISAGVWSHNRHPENFYLVLGLARNHNTDEEMIVYVPLRTEPEWAGTARMALRPAREFIENFTFVNTRLP